MEKKNRKKKLTKQPKVSESKDTKLADSQGKEETWRDQFLRVSADLQNFKRRVEKEKSQWVLAGQIQIIEAILPFIDELELAVKSSEKFESAQEMKPWIEGFAIMFNNLQKRLTALGVKEIDCSGAFDPHYHEALMQVDSPEHTSGDIVAVMQRGYLFNDHVIRHAKVNVAK